MSANIVTVDEESLRKDIKNLVRKTVEETLNALLDEEASELVGAGRYERTAGREAYRSGHYARKLVTGAGEVELNVPKLRGATFQTAVIERYRRRETSVEEAIVEMYLAGVSTRRIEDVSVGRGEPVEPEAGALGSSFLISTWLRSQPPTRMLEALSHPSISSSQCFHN